MLSEWSPSREVHEVLSGHAGQGHQQTCVWAPGALGWLALSCCWQVNHCPGLRSHELWKETGLSLKKSGIPWRASVWIAGQLPISPRWSLWSLPSDKTPVMFRCRRHRVLPQQPPSLWWAASVSPSASCRAWQSALSSIFVSSAWRISPLIDFESSLWQSGQDGEGAEPCLRHAGMFGVLQPSSDNPLIDCNDIKTLTLLSESPSVIWLHVSEVDRLHKYYPHMCTSFGLYCWNVMK